MLVRPGINSSRALCNLPVSLSVRSNAKLLERSNVLANLAPGRSYYWANANTRTNARTNIRSNISSNIRAHIGTYIVNPWTPTMSTSQLQRQTPHIQSGPYAIRYFSQSIKLRNSKPSKSPDTSNVDSSPLKNDPNTESKKQTPLEKFKQSKLSANISANLSAIGSSALMRENIWNVPNVLTLSRLAASPVIGYWVVNGQTTWALSLFVYSCITDMLDGIIARKYNMKTVVGSVIDPMADKALMITLASCLAVSGDIPLYLSVLILGRDVLLGLSAVYYRYISLPPPKTFWRYWDFSIPSAEVHPTQISKINTFLQMIYLGSSLVFPTAQAYLASVGLLDNCTLALQYFGYVVGSTTVLSGLSYVFSKDAVKILTKAPKT